MAHPPLGDRDLMYVTSSEQLRDLCHKVLSLVILLNDSTQREGALLVSIQTLLLFNV